MSRTVKEILLLFVISIVAAFVLYIPFLNNVEILTRYWDGPNYMYLAKTLYIFPKHYALLTYNNYPKYFASHLPLYPLLIRLFSYLLNYEMGMLFVSVAASALLSVVFYLLLLELNISKRPFWVVFLSIFLPPRMLIYRNLGATESLFLLFVFGSFLCFYKNKITSSFILAGLSSVTRIFGLLLFPVYLFELVLKKSYKKIPLLLFTILPIFMTFVYYRQVYGSFFAYFDINNHLLNPVPLALFITYTTAHFTHSSEYFLLLYLVYGIAIFYSTYTKDAQGSRVNNYKSVIFNFNLLYFITMLFVYHIDLSRFMFILAPFSLMVPLGEIFERKYMKLLLFMIIPLVYIYSWNIIPGNLINQGIYDQLVRSLGE